MALDAKTTISVTRSSTQSRKQQHLYSTHVNMLASIKSPLGFSVVFLRAACNSHDQNAPQNAAFAVTRSCFVANTIDPSALHMHVNFKDCHAAPGVAVVSEELCPVRQVTAQTEEVIRCRVHQRNMATTVEKLQLCIPGAPVFPHHCSFKTECNAPR